MDFLVWTRYEPIMLHLILQTKSKEPIVIKAFDSKQANTVFTDSEKNVNGVQDFYIRMPLAPNTVTVSVYNKKKGDLPKGIDDSFQVNALIKEPLQITLSKTNMDTPLVRDFVSFAQKFCYKAGYLPVNHTYESANGKFKIEYLDTIIGSNGRNVSTPARISVKNGKIQVAKQFFANCTIPMRMAILLHEFCHYYVNTDISNEIEADLNALTIYLGLGYPVKEAFQAFLKTFYGYPSEQNKQRFQIIEKFIVNYVNEYHLKDVYAKQYA